MVNTSKPKVGDKAWFVEWCSELAFYNDDPTGDVDHDSCRMLRKKFATKEDAASFARKIWPVTQQTFGVVEYWQSEFVPYDEADAVQYPWAGYWEVISDVVYVDDEGESP